MSTEVCESGEAILTSPTAARIAGIDRIHFARLIRDGKGPKHQKIVAGDRHLVLILRCHLDEWIRRRSSNKRSDKQPKRTLIPKDVRSLVLLRDDFTCVYCGIKKGQCVFPGAFRVVIHIDHIVPACRGGSSTNIFNLCCACSSCNMHKSSKTPQEAGMFPAFLRSGFVFKDNQIVPEDDEEATDGTHP